MRTILLVSLLIAISHNALAFDVAWHPVTKNVYAYLGSTGMRTAGNLAMNNNSGLVRTQAGWVFVGSGTGRIAADGMIFAAKRIADIPIAAVINLGSQDHRWMGNDEFQKRGVKIIALRVTAKEQPRVFDDHMARFKKISPLLRDDRMTTADVVYRENRVAFTIGGVRFVLEYFGDAHFPGDAVLYLPEKEVLFSGDVIFVDRLLGISPHSNVVTWSYAFQKAKDTFGGAKHIVPGHGNVCKWKKAQAETGDYLERVSRTATAAAKDMVGVGAYVEANKDWVSFRNLRHYTVLHRKNLSRAYLRLEAAM